MQKLFDYLEDFNLSILNAVTRKKVIEDNSSGCLVKCRPAWQLAILGIGTTIGPGLYVISGQVARETAGPGVIASFGLAFIACVLSAVCYAEFAVRMPRAGISYAYCYVTVGELVAFIVGWNIVFESIIAFAVSAKAWSRYLDSFTNDTIRNHFEHFIMPEHWPTHFDIIAFFLITFFAIVVINGAHVTANVNLLFTIINLLVGMFIVGFGAFYADFSNWSVFAPFGITGIIKGSGKCFYSMLDVDVVAMTCDASDDKRTVPKAIIFTLVACFLLYLSTSAVLTLIIPWFEIDVAAAFPRAFESIGFQWARYVIAVGAVASLSTAILANLHSAAETTF